MPAKISPLAVLFEPVIMTKVDGIVIGSYARIDGFVKLEGGGALEIGEYTHVASFCHLGIGGGFTYIGKYVALSSGAKVISGSNLTTSPSLSATAPKDLQEVQQFITRIGDFACVFTNAVVLPGITLGEGAVLGAGSVATHDIPPWEVWLGNPARRLGKRDRARAKVYGTEEALR